MTQRVSSTDEAYRLVKGGLEKRTQDAALQRRMGNVLMNGGRPDLALPYYLEKVGRNDPCPCGSGKKARTVAAGQAPLRSPATGSPTRIKPCVGERV
ncbi:MAG: SEC-C domain-containing protein [Chloroflexi bacterium]|nr:SEC-C domain-containing protein [Chloroflexota bacterium]